MLKNIFILSILVLYTSCGGKNFTVNQVDSHSYLLIKGQSNKEQVYIDSSEPLTLGVDTKEYKMDDDTNASKIQISEGSHVIKVMRNGAVIIQRKFFVTSGNTFEVNL